MKFFIVFALILVLATVFGLPSKEIKSRNVVVPAGTPQGRITGGRTASQGVFPHQVGLLREKYDGKYTWCGGSLISNTHVLTAAHCTENAKSIEVLLGSNNRNNPKVTYTILPKDIVIHERWNKDTVENDISLIKIPFTKYSKFIKAIDLPSNDTEHVGEIVTASGWGRVKSSITGIQDNLQFAKMKLISNDLCAKTFRIKPTQICISTLGKTSVCNGDSGGPLVLDSSKTLLGLASFVAKNGCEEEYPAVFTRVATFLDWIQRNSK